MTYHGNHESDPLGPARGVVYGAIGGVVLWALIVFVVWRWLG